MLRLAALRKAVAQQPKDARPYFYLGQSLQALGRTPEAITAWRPSVALDPSNFQANVALARAMEGVSPEKKQQY
jgi:cytochrome c-type biogenesis protein CcmH/NrfG